jgi:hypothetical protein
MANPFVIDSPAPSSELIDREEELRTLLELAEGGHNSRLTAPRRFGKTTLLTKLGEEAEKAGMQFVLVDFFGVLSLGDVARRIERAYVEALKGPVASWYAGLRRRWRVRGRAGLPEAGIELESLPASEAQEQLEQLLDLPKSIHRRTGNATLVAFDEFQAVLAAADAIDALIRSRIQHHGPAASYVFAGSQPGLLAELFGDRERPLFGQARAVSLGPLDDTALAEYIDSRFRDTGRDASPIIDDLLELVRGHPQRAMLVAHHLWDVTPARGTAGGEEWEAAVQGALSELQEAFERSWELRSANERRTLAAVSWTGKWGMGETLYAKSTLERFRLSKGTTRTVSQKLLRSGDLRRDEDDGRVTLVDPLFEAWIASGGRPRF